MRSFVIATAAAALVGIAQSNTLHQQSIGVELKGYVPVACYLTLRPQAFINASNSGRYQLGAMSEFCNSSSGFQIVADYGPQELAGARLIVDGRAIDLNESGRAILVDSALPDRRTRNLALETNRAIFGSPSISISISAKL